MRTIYIEERRRVASLDIDAQKCFTPLCPEELPVPEGNLIVSELNAQADYASLRLASKEAHSPSAHWVATEHKPMLTTIDAENMDKHWPVHAVPGTQGFELLEGLPPISAYHFVVWKGVELDFHPYGACFHDIQEKLSTGLIEFLRAREITTIIAGGLATDVCVKATVLQLLQANFSVILNLGACRGLTEASTRAAIDVMEKRGAIIIPNASALRNKNHFIISEVA